MSIRLAFYSLKGRPYYVLVQHGFPNDALAVGFNRKAVMDQIVRPRNTTFKAWTRKVKRSASVRSYIN
jgi:hypothetical protein